MVDGDTSVVMVGGTEGDFDGVAKGGYDGIAIKVDSANGTEIWRYQVSLDSYIGSARQPGNTVMYR